MSAPVALCSISRMILKGWDRPVLAPISDFCPGTWQLRNFADLLKLASRHIHRDDLPILLAILERPTPPREFKTFAQEFDLLLPSKRLQSLAALPSSR